MIKLDPEEKEILDAFEDGKLKRVKNSASQMDRHKSVAKNTLEKDAHINIRLPSSDLRALQARALKEGISYQTLVSSVLHKYAGGQLVEKTTSR